MKKFVIVGYPRTGSSYLMRMLLSHPKVFCAGEIFNASMHGNVLKNVTHPSVYLESFFHTSKTHYGFKLFSQHARTPPLNFIWEYLKEQKFLVILLTRKNLMNRYLSEQLVWAHSTKEKQAWSDVPFTKAINIDAEKFIKDAVYYKKEEQWLLNQFDKNPLFKILYEDLSPTKESYGRVLDFLELEWSFPNINMQKQRKRTQQVMIKNYWELKRLLKNTEYAVFFDELEKDVKII